MPVTADLGALKPGQQVDVLDLQDVWGTATIKAVGKGQAEVSWNGWGPEYDSSTPFSRIAPLHTHTRRSKAWVRISDKYPLWPAEVTIRRPLAGSKLGPQELLLEERALVHLFCAPRVDLKERVWWEAKKLSSFYHQYASRRKPSKTHKDFQAALEMAEQSDIPCLSLQFCEGTLLAEDDWHWDSGDEGDKEAGGSTRGESSSKGGTAPAGQKRTFSEMSAHVEGPGELLGVTRVTDEAWDVMVESKGHLQYVGTFKSAELACRCHDVAYLNKYGDTGHRINRHLCDYQKVPETRQWQLMANKWRGLPDDTKPTPEEVNRAIEAQAGKRGPQRAAPAAPKASAKSSWKGKQKAGTQQGPPTVSEVLGAPPPEPPQPVSALAIQLASRARDLPEDHPWRFRTWLQEFTAVLFPKRGPKPAAPAWSDAEAGVKKKRKQSNPKHISALCPKSVGH